jgi:hypothetical protein
MSAKELITDRLPDLAACALLAAFGLAAVYVGASYPIGSITRMSAGFFPVAASVAVVGLAVAAALEALFTERVKQAFKWRPLIFIAVAILAWTQLIDSLGIIPSTFALILISGMAKRPFHPISLLVTAAVLCLAGYLVFVMGLRMPLTALGR